MRSIIAIILVFFFQNTLAQCGGREMGNYGRKPLKSFERYGGYTINFKDTIKRKSVIYTRVFKKDWYYFELYSIHPTKSKVTVKIVAKTGTGEAIHIAPRKKFGHEKWFFHPKKRDIYTIEFSFTDLCNGCRCGSAILYGRKRKGQSP